MDQVNITFSNAYTGINVVLHYEEGMIKTLR